MVKNRSKPDIKLDLKGILYVILSVLIIMVLFALFDYIIHQLSSEYVVPSYYFKNKMIYGIIWGLVFYFVFRKWNTNLGLKTFVFAALVSLILQVRYAYEGYSWEFVIEFLFFHFFILWPVSYIIFSFFRKMVKF